MEVVRGREALDAGPCRAFFSPPRRLLSLHFHLLLLALAILFCSHNVVARRPCPSFISSSLSNKSLLKHRFTLRPLCFVKTRISSSPLPKLPLTSSFPLFAATDQNKKESPAEKNTGNEAGELRKLLTNDTKEKPLLVYLTLISIALLALGVGTYEFGGPLLGLGFSDDSNFYFDAAPSYAPEPPSQDFGGLLPHHTAHLLLPLPRPGLGAHERARIDHGGRSDPLLPHLLLLAGHGGVHGDRGGGREGGKRTVAQDRCHLLINEIFLSVPAEACILEREGVPFECKGRTCPRTGERKGLGTDP
ncbi:hypothetical protein Naga_100422g1 [Nannochloropsis gaditana]|uniref:Uncharacterized protein n=1 Tax=Nannochloropsis gaditana TaxID=72520 RepID=W7T1V3_9STRA|nr:hypothetical protein Naga_100422g1 [Nannochloropsis gaditana]